MRTMGISGIFTNAFGKETAFEIEDGVVSHGDLGDDEDIFYKELSRHPYREKYLNLLEELIINANPDEKDVFLSELYIICHLAHGKCENKHLDWQKQIDDKYNL